MGKPSDYFLSLEKQKRKLEHLGIKGSLYDDELIDLLLRISASIEALANASNVSLFIDHRGRVCAQSRRTGEVFYGSTRH